MAKGFSVLPKRGLKLTPGKEGKLLPEGSKFAVYGKKKPTLLPRKAGRVAEKGAYGAVNRYYAKGGRKVVSKVYSSKYRRIPSGDKTFAVRISGEKFTVDGKINDSAIGWVSESGQLTTLKDFRDSLISIDATTVGRAYGENVLVEMWDSLSLQEKAKIINEFADFDWAGMWAEFYPSGFSKDGSDPNVDNQYMIYDEIVQRIEYALSR